MYRLVEKTCNLVPSFGMQLIFVAKVFKNVTNLIYKYLFLLMYRSQRAYKVIKTSVEKDKIISNMKTMQLKHLFNRQKFFSQVMIPLYATDIFQTKHLATFKICILIPCEENQLKLHTKQHFYGCSKRFNTKLNLNHPGEIKTQPQKYYRKI